MRIQQLDKNTKTHLLEDLLKRSPNNYGKYEAGVLKILSRVREEGDQAVFDFTRQFDQAEITADTIRVTKEEIEAFIKSVLKRQDNLMYIPNLLKTYFKDKINKEYSNNNLVMVSFINY